MSGLRLACRAGILTVAMQWGCASSIQASTGNMYFGRAENALSERSRTSIAEGPSAAAGLLDDSTQTATTPHAGMLRYPDVSSKQIVFVFANDLWLVSRDGGTAERLASPLGEESFPKFSPDEKTIAFVGNYDGNRDIYTLPVSGGVPVRVTYHPDGEMLQDWTPNGLILFNSSRSANIGWRQRQIFTVPPGGGLPTRLPVPYGMTGSISSDGVWLAYTPHSIDFRTWKRYRGGMQTDIWLFNLKTLESRRITDWEGTDSIPMWHGDCVYYLSDQGPEHRGNIWKYDARSGQRTQVTKFADYDVKWPSMGPGPDGEGEIVFQYGPELRLLDLKTHQMRAVTVTIPGDRPRIRPILTGTSDMIRGADLSPGGKRVVMEARGDLYSLPAKEGSVRALTSTSGVHERSPSWSPDGRWIAYFSDATGEYELYLTQSDGVGETRQITRDSRTFYYNPTWSPDSKRIAFCDKAGNLYLHSLDDGTTKIFDVEPWSNQPGMSWSHDSDWIAYTKLGDNVSSAIWLYQVSKDEKYQVTSGMFNDQSPTFDRKGEFLYYTSLRDFTSPLYEDVGTTFVYSNTGVMFAVPLRKDVKSPLLPRSDEEEWRKKGEKKDEARTDRKDGDGKSEGGKSDDAADKKDETSPPVDKPADQSRDTSPASPEEKKESDKNTGKDKKEDVKPLVIDLDGFEARAVLLPVKRGNFGGLAVNADGHLIYIRFPDRGFGNDEGPGPSGTIKIIDLSSDEKEEKTVISGVGGFGISADGKKLLVFKSLNESAVVDARPDQKMDKRVPTGELRADIDPRAEWKQIFREAWRIQRDFFYDPNMHGVDWEKVYQQYEVMLSDCVSREDVSFLIKEMISELNVGHAYYFGGDEEKQPSLSVGMPGCEFTLENGAYRISKLYGGAAWDTDARGPLRQPGLDVKEGDYLLAVNGRPLDVRKDPYAAFQGLAEKTVTLTISDKPQRDDTARDIVVRLASSDADLRYRGWIERNRRYVSEKSGGKIGYIHVPDTGINGQNNLFRQFYGQIDKAALIIDERWNGGGQIPTRFIELLNRPVTNYWARRHGKDWTWPPDSHQGPKCMLINGLAGSGGDMFPWLFRHNNLGKLIGTRTWGGLVGISGNPGLIDGGIVTAPTFAFYEKDGTWGVEGHGVDPDIEVIDDPAKMQDDHDPQLEAAIAHLLSEIERAPYTKPPRPAYPDRRGMGIAPKDK